MDEPKDSVKLYLTRAEAIAAGIDVSPYLNRKEAVAAGEDIQPMTRNESAIQEGKEGGGSEIEWLKVQLEIRDEYEELDPTYSFITGYGVLDNVYYPGILSGSDLTSGVHDIYIPIVEHLAMITFEFNTYPGYSITITKNGVTKINGTSNCYTVNKNNATILVNIQQDK